MLGGVGCSQMNELILAFVRERIFDCLETIAFKA
jgi:hypothetical protein